MTIKIKNEDDRRTVAGILVANGYTVKVVKIKDGGVTKTAIEAEEEASNGKR